MLRVESVAWQTVGGWYFEFLSGSRGGKDAKTNWGLARSTSCLSVKSVKSVVSLLVYAIFRCCRAKRAKHGPEPGASGA